MPLFVSCAGAWSSGRAGSECSNLTLGLSLVHTLHGTGSPAGSARPGSYRWAWLVCSPGPGARGQLSQTHGLRREGEFSKDSQVLLIQENAPHHPASRGNGVVGAEEVLPLGNLFLDFLSTRRFTPVKLVAGWRVTAAFCLHPRTSDFGDWFTGERTSGLRWSRASMDTFPARTMLGSNPQKQVPGV